MTRVLVAGATGRLGSPVCAAIIAADDLTLAGRVARSLDGRDDGFGGVGDALAATAPDVLVDVTAPDVGEGHALAALAAGVPVVLGTTGIPADGLTRIDAAAKDAGAAALYVPNFAITAVLMMRFAVEAARVVPDCAIVEEHHANKLDRPSGTSKRTAELIEAVTGVYPEISSLRLDGVVANQSVVFGAPGQTLEIRHVTTSREAFVPGVLLSVRRIGGLAPGLHEGLETVLD